MEALNIFEQAERLFLQDYEGEIRNQGDYEKLGDYLKTVKSLSKDLETMRKEEVQPFLDGQREVQGRYKPYLDKLDRTAILIGRAMTQWTIEQEKIRQEVQRKLTEQARLEEEKKKKELEERAKKWKEKGNETKAEMLREQAETTVVPIPIIQTKIEQPEGQHIRSVWKGRIVNIKKIPHEYVLAWFEPIQSKIDKFASSTKGAILIEGIEFYEEKSIVTRR